MLLAGATVAHPGSAQTFHAALLGSFGTRVALLDAPTLVGKKPVRLAVQLCNAGARVEPGALHVLSTAAWQVQPARSLPFRLAASDCLDEVLEIALPEHTSPGPYECVLRLEAGGREVGTLCTRLVKPVEWVVVGPFAPPPPGELLLPERGVVLERDHPGLGGAVRWRDVPALAYDATGALELDLVYGAADRPRCACALTVLDFSVGERLHWTATGADRLVVDGRVLRDGEPLGVGPGQHMLLARTCGRDRVWRLGITLVRDDGTWPQSLDNDLGPVLKGFDTAAGDDETAHRHVVLQVSEPAARDVQVLGTFNAWVPSPLERAANGHWQRALVLPPGRYAYKLCIDGRMLPDPRAARSEDDGFGGRNSVLIVR